MCSATVKNIHSDLQRVSLSQRWILTNLRLPFKRLYNTYPPNKVYHLVQSPSRQLCFLSSSCSRSSQCSHSQTFKAKKALHIVSSPSQCQEQAVVAFTTQSSSTENAVERQYAMQTISPLGVWGRDKGNFSCGSSAEKQTSCLDWNHEQLTVVPITQNRTL